MTQARLKLSQYTTRVLDVIKGKYGLKNRDEALNVFVNKFGSQFVSPDINEDILKELDDLTQKHIKKYGYRTMKLKDVDRLLEQDV